MDFSCCKNLRLYGNYSYKLFRNKFETDWSIKQRSSDVFFTYGLHFSLKIGSIWDFRYWLQTSGRTPLCSNLCISENLHLKNHTEKPFCLEHVSLVIIDDGSQALSIWKVKRQLTAGRNTCLFCKLCFPPPPKQIPCACVSLACWLAGGRWVTSRRFGVLLGGHWSSTLLLKHKLQYILIKYVWCVLSER